MSCSPANKVRKIISSVSPSNISSIFKTPKQKDEEHGLEEVEAQQPLPSTSRETVISIIEENQSTTALRKGLKRVDGESTPQSSIENVTRPVADPVPSTSWVRTSPPPTPQQQNDHDENMDEMIAAIMDSDDEGKKMAQNKLKNLKKVASAPRKKNNSFASDNLSPPSSSQSESVRQPIEPLPERAAGSAQKKKKKTVPEDPDKITTLPAAGDGQRDRAVGFVQENIQNVKKKKAPPPSSLVRRRRPDHVTIEMGFMEDADNNAAQRSPTYLETYLGYMFNCCLSPFKPDGSTGGIWSYCMKFCFIQVIIYWVLTIVAILQTLASTKVNCLRNIADGGLENFTNMCFFIMNSCLRIYSAYLFTVQQQRFAKMLRSLARLRAFAEQHSNVQAERYQTWKVTLLAVLSMTISVLSVVFASGLHEWTLDKGILEYTWKMSIAAYVWTPEGASEKGEQMGLLYQEFGESITKRNALIGLVGLVTHMCTRIIANGMSDLILATAATIEKEMDQVAKDVGNPENDLFPITMENFEAEDGQWTYYLLLQQTIEDTNDTFDSLLRYIHVDNLMLIVFFAMNVFDNDLSFFSIINFTYNITKAICTYRIATKASGKNETFQAWIRRLIWKSNDNNFTRKAYVILEHMKIHPLGLGRGNFLIDENFMFRLFGTSGSVFVLQAQSRESLNQPCRSD